MLGGREVEAGAGFALGLREGAEVAVEVAARRGDPRERPTLALLVGDDVVEPGPRRAQEGHAELREVEDRAAEVVGGERAAGAPLGHVGAEHEVVDDELGPAVEELAEGLGAVLGVEAVLLLDRHPRELAAQARELVAASRQLLLALE